MDAYAHAAEIVRERDRDRYLADLFAPEAARRHLFALHAFNAEVARVREAISEPLPGEIRLQWWRDAIVNAEPAGHPIAEAVIETIKAVALPLPAFDNLVKARIFDLYDDPMETSNDLDGYLGDTSSGLIQLGAIVLAGGQDPNSAEAAGHAGVAYGLTGIMRALPFTAARRQLFLPADTLKRHGAEPESIFSGEATPAVRAALAELRGRARAHLELARLALGEVAPAALPAFLPVALADAYLGQMEQPGYDPFRTPVEVPQWRRQWRLWRAARSRRI
jgi:phytoene synthase